MNVVCRLATADDTQLIYRFIVELAEYEKGGHLVSATPDLLEKQMLDKDPPFESLIAEIDGQAVGFALFFPSYSTWEAKAGLYLEDLYVVPEARKFGVGRALFTKLGEIARERNYARIDWKVLNWNQLAIDFYERIGATSMSDWTGYRLSVPEDGLTDSRENTSLLAVG